ncbi:disease resistance protein RPV1-like [Macadamia integrifolia]|uniref:disease resistance protein RPV1-like n=1 Tax=Macadamia integrifolia TaxID=60698 RepID=UPI001C4FD2E3|nr:disease resistance protein RPV1-like [Macadamia integrifolia]
MEHHHQASSSSSSSGSSYEVFLNFNGIDVRTSFADCLYNSLVYAGIRTFRDEDELHKGNKMGSELLAAIQESRISIPIFSKNYASSKWCLNELIEISDCRRTMDQIVLPIFYKVEPREVRNQTGGYGKAFEDHQMCFDETTVQKWKKAMREVGELDGWDTKTNPYEGKLIRDVIKTVWSTLNKRPLIVSENLVGINFHIKEMLMLIDIKSDNRKIVGIHGLGGIGKTTIARAIYNAVFQHFEGYSFIENIQENTKKYGLPHLQNQLIFDISKQENQNITSVDNGINVIRQRLFNRKVLIVLDDVDQDIQAESLVGDREWFGIGSKIIITSRNKDILIARKVDGIYEPNVMDSDDSLKLFCHHAFGRDQPLEDYLDLSKAIVKTSGGLPLALRVIGSSLFSKRKFVWEGMLKKLQKIPNNDVMKRLKISYDGLEDVEQQMFLDTACFFIGMNKAIACHIWEGCDFSPEVGLDVLCVNSLITISEDGKLRMHDLLRDLGREIVRQENIDEPGKRTRIWFQEEVLAALNTRAGTSNVKGLSIAFRHISRSQCLMSEGFAAMTRLRLLQVDYAQTSGIMTNSFSELRWLSWRGCPDRYALTNFCPQKLVVLDLSHSKITKNWTGWNCIKMAVNLKVLNLTSCHRLSSTPDVSENRLLEVLLLKDCKNLEQIDTSICFLTNLVILDMSGCEGLIELPEKLDLVIKLTTLDLSCCVKLESIPTLPKHLEVLILNGCGNLVGINTSIGCLRNLVTLDLRGFWRLVDLPSEICQLTSLERLDLGRCGNLKKLPEKFGRLISLTTLVFKNCTSLVDLPSEISQLTSLKELNFERCGNLKKLPEKLGHMISLTTLDLQECKSLNKLPDKLGCMTSLTTLDIRGCGKLESLPILPSSLKYVDASYCALLGSLPMLSSLKNLENLFLRGCKKLLHISGLPSSLASLNVSHCSSIQYISGCLSSLSSLDATYCVSMVKLSSSSSGGLRNLKTLCIDNCTSLEELEGAHEKLDCLQLLSTNWCTSLRKLPNLRGSKNLMALNLYRNDAISEFEGEGMDSLEVLEIESCQSLRKIPNLRDSKRLRRLEIKDCPELFEIEGLEDFEYLETLSISEAASLKALPEISNLKNLIYFRISRCDSMERLPNLSNLKELWHLVIEYCKKLTEIIGLDRLESLLELKIYGCIAIERLPDLSKLHKLKYLKIEGCKNLNEIHGVDRLEFLWKLDISGCESLKRLPDLSNLQELNGLKIEGCKNLTKIHGIEGLEFLEDLDISGCESLERLPDLSNLNKLQILRIEWYGNLTEIPTLGKFKSLRRLEIGCRGIERLPDLFQNFKKLNGLKIEGCKNLAEIHGVEGLEFLEDLDISGCEFLERLPDLSNLRSLKDLKIEGCKNLIEIHGVNILEFLRNLDVSGCESLERLPDLSNLKNLEQLKANDCKKLTEIQADTGLESLKLLDIRGCTSLEKLPDLTKSRRLWQLNGVVCYWWVHKITTKFVKPQELLTDGGYTKLQPDLSNL